MVQGAPTSSTIGVLLQTEATMEISTAAAYKGRQTGSQKAKSTEAECTKVVRDVDKSPFMEAGKKPHHIPSIQQAFFLLLLSRLEACFLQ